jgi:uncharacterized membrane protein
MRLTALAILIAWCFALIGMRVAWSGSFTYLFLVWNLLLASIPVAAALMFRRALSAGRARASAAVWAVAWLAFLPNAPYIATDLMHLRPRSFVPLWYDVAMLLSCAITGIILGYVSIEEVQRAVRSRVSAAAAWVGIAAVLFLSAFGIYLGRFRRWNSWELVTDPLSLLIDASSRLFHPLSHPRTLAVTFVYGFTLLVGYVVFHLLVTSRMGAGLRPESVPRAQGDSRCAVGSHL